MITFGRMKRILDSYRFWVGTYITLLKKDKGEIRPDDIHRIRMCIKKIRALRLLLHHIDPGGYPIHKPDVFQILFQCAGKLRETQLILHALKNYPASDKGYIVYVGTLQKEEKKQRTLFLRTFEHFTVTDSKRTGIMLPESILSDRLVIRRGASFIKRKIKKLKRLCKDPLREDELHKVRKLLKILEPVLGMANAFSGIFADPDQLKKLRKAGKQLGLWHDQTVLLSNLKSYLKEHNNPETKKGPLSVLHKQIRKEVNKKSREVKKKTGKLIRSF